MLSASLRFVSLSSFLCALCGCVTTEPTSVVPHVNVSPAEVELAPGARAGGVTIGCELERVESDTLDDLEVLPGARIRRVDREGPAAAAGLRAGDVILVLDGAPVGDPDVVEARLARAADGEVLRVETRRDTVVFEAAVVARALAAGAPARELFRADPLLTRAGYVTDCYGLAEVLVARIVRLFPESPLAAAGLDVGDAVLALDGEPVRSAHDLVRRLLEEHEPGDRVRLQVLDPDRGSVEERTVRLWSPGRRLSRLALLPLFFYSSDLEPARTELSFIDLWLFSLFSYQRLGGEREYRILGLIRFGTGHGQLIEEGAP